MPTASWTEATCPLAIVTPANHRPISTQGQFMGVACGYRDNVTQIDRHVRLIITVIPGNDRLVFSERHAKIAATGDGGHIAQAGRHNAPARSPTVNRAVGTQRKVKSFT